MMEEKIENFILDFVSYTAARVNPVAVRSALKQWSNDGLVLVRMAHIHTGDEWCLANDDFKTPAC